MYRIASVRLYLAAGGLLRRGRKNDREKIFQTTTRVLFNFHYLYTMKKKDVFSKVEADARKMLKNPDTRGAAQTVLEYIEEQRKRIKDY